MKTLASAFALMAGLSAPASAADIYTGSTKDDPLTQFVNSVRFKGFYVSGFVGGAVTDTKIGAADYGFSGFAGRGVVGYDVSPGGEWRLGIYGEIGAQDVKGNALASSTDTIHTLTQTLSYGGGVKVGYQVGSAELYTKFGYAGVHVSGGGFDKDLQGLAITPGAQIALGNGWSLDPEVRVVFYRDETVSKGVKLANDSIEPMLGVTYHFQH